MNQIDCRASGRAREANGDPPEVGWWVPGLRHVTDASGHRVRQAPKRDQFQWFAACKKGRHQFGNVSPNAGGW